MNSPIIVMHIIDSLDLGGAERVAVNLTNALAESGVETHLCVSRNDGPLHAFVSEKVHLFMLNKKSSIDLLAYYRLFRYIRQNKINIIHAHSSSVFLASVVSFCNRHAALLWHDHFGRAIDNRSSLGLRLVKYRINHVYSVNYELRQWAINVLRIKPAHVEFLQNYPDIIHYNGPVECLQGDGDYKIIHLAALRPQKDHFTLLRAAQELPNCDFYLAGKDFNDSYSLDVHKYIEKHQLKNVHLLGGRSDVADILHSCDIGVLSSESEGLPVSLLEYGLVGLPVVCTRVGECPAVLGHGEYGLLVDKGDSQGLVSAIRALLEDESLRSHLSKAFHENVMCNYSKKAIINKIIVRYYQLIGE